MIRYPTVLVLGAGASIPYGFPSGQQLKNKICTQTFGNQMLETFGHSEVQNFVNAFMNSHVNSIDSFLARREDYVNIGKLAIASIISGCENPTSFNEPIDDDWYTLLWNKLIADVHNIEDFGKNNLKIITFNYDRSLEYFLLTSIIFTFGVGIAAAQTALKLIPIHHFYGHLGDLSHSYSEGCLPYQREHSTDFTFQAAQNIKIIPEHRDNLESNELIKSWFVNARNIFILGFGFDPLNISRLGLSKTLEEHYNGNTDLLSVRASTYKLTASEASLAGTLLMGKSKAISWGSVNDTCSGTLRQFAETFI